MKKYIKSDTEINTSWAKSLFWSNLSQLTQDLVNQFVDLEHLDMRDHNVWFNATMAYSDELWKMIEPHLQENDDLCKYDEDNHGHLYKHGSYFS